MPRSHAIVLIAISVVLIGAAILTWRIVGSDRNSGDATGTAALAGSAEGTGGEASFTDLTGTPVSLDSYRGEVVVVTSWASWCPQCRESLAAADAAAAALASEGVDVLAINRSESPARIERYLRGLPEYEHLILVRDTADHFYDTTGGYAMPETVVINERGEVVTQLRGVATPDAIITAARQAGE